MRLIRKFIVDGTEEAIEEYMKHAVWPRLACSAAGQAAENVWTRLQPVPKSNLNVWVVYSENREPDSVLPDLPGVEPKQ